MRDKIGEAPVFVKIDDYKDILDILELINEEDSELELWKSTLNEIERKVENIDRTLLEPEGAW